MGNLLRRFKMRGDGRSGKRFREGFGVVELMLALGIVAVIITGVIYVYNRIYGSSKLSTKKNEVISLLQVLDSIENNNGAFPAASDSDITTDPVISNYLGQNKTPLIGIKYSCSEGTDVEADLKIPVRFFDAKLDLAKQFCVAVGQAVEHQTDWKADTSQCNSNTGYLRLYREHVVCKSFSSSTW